MRLARAWPDRAWPAGAWSARAWRVPGGEQGSGPISTWIGFVVFLLILLFGVQVMVNLYATSVVSSAAYDAARLAAAGGGTTEAVSGAEARARDVLGRIGDGARFDWSGTGSDEVVVRVQARVPGVLPAIMGGPVAFGQIDRTIRIRVERFR